MKKLTVIIAALLLSGCSGMFLRYTYEPALQSLPDCSKVHAINNKYITYSRIEPKVITKSNIEFNITYTNYVSSVTNIYHAYYTSDGKIYKTVLSTEDAK